MRLWHKDLIPYLPKKQLSEQWQTCRYVAARILKGGFVFNETELSRVTDYRLSHFYKYCMITAEEIYKRGYTIPETESNEIADAVSSEDKMAAEYISQNELFPSWHDEEYFKLCFYELEELYDCGKLPHKDWIKIIKVMDNIYNN